MNNDQKYAVAIGLLSTTLLSKTVRYPFLEFMAHPLSVVIAAIVVLYLVVLEYTTTAVVIVMVALYLFSEWSLYTRTPERKLYIDSVDDDARFSLAHSVDLQWGSKVVKHDPPKILQGVIPPTEPLLTYPPSAETLFSMNG
jgi:hypothetical protein